MSWLFNACYGLLLFAASPLIVWRALRYGKYRQGWRAKLFGLVDSPACDAPTIWVHAVSVGEVKLATKIVPALVERLPGRQFVISTTSLTGYRLAQREFVGHCVTYAPLDFSWAVHKALDRLRPEAIVLVELELWPNLIRLASERGVQLFIVNGRLSEASFHGYLRIKPLVSKLLQRIAWIGAQDEVYRRRFVALGASRCEVTGSIKFDSLETDRGNERTAELVAASRLQSDDMVLMAGSTQSVEDEIVMATFRKLVAAFPQLRLVLVPRHPENFETACQLAANSGLVWQRRSRLGQQPNLDWRVLVVDSVGELSAWWGRSDIAFVGGSLCSRGGQNMIEPAAFGAAVCFGPNTVNFQSVSDALLQREGAVVVHHAADLESFLRRCCEDQTYRSELGAAAAVWARSQSGALKRSCERIAAHCCVERQKSAA